MPDSITEPKTNKQKLMNSVITFLTERNCSWRANEESSVAVSLVTALTDTLWIIDGHHHIFSSQGCRIPSTFTKFVANTMDLRVIAGKINTTSTPITCL